MLSALSQQLARAISRLSEGDDLLGQPDLVEKAAEESARLFQKSAKALPSKEDARAAALALLRKKDLNDRQVDLVAGVLCDPVAEYNGALPVGQEQFLSLLGAYRTSAESNDLPRLTWYALLSSYFKFNPSGAAPAELSGWESLRSFLQETWPLIDREAGDNVVPDWLKVLRGDRDLLGEKAAARYAVDYLRGNEVPIQQLATDLAIPQSSWFWHVLVLAAVGRAARAPDEQFKGIVSKLITLIQSRPVYRDEALIALLTRYYDCREKPVHAELRDYVVRKDVWRNPKLKAAGMATTWNRVGDHVWRMVLNWVNESNLRDFFGILASRNHADEGRLDFWTKYLNQISWTRLMFGSETMTLARRNRQVAELVAREEGVYAQLVAGSRESDAFMMQIGEYIIVEFSVTNNAAYVYPSEELKFDRHARTYEGNATDLKYGFYGGYKARIVHRAPWEQIAALDLKRLGIYPDSASQTRRGPDAPFVARPPPSPARSSTQAREASHRPPVVRRQGPSVLNQAVNPAASGARPYRAQAPRGALFKMAVLAEMVGRIDGAHIVDSRETDGGRLWVENPRQVFQLEKMLRHWGFVWGQSRGAYYFPEER